MAGPFTVTVPALTNKAAPIPVTVTVPQPASPPATCAELAAGAPRTVTDSIVVTAAVASQCTVSATSLAFPTASVLTNPASARAAISVTCNTSAPVTIALDNGATGTGPTARRMRSGANAITYGIYRDAAATLPWGNTSGANTASLGSGTGTLTAYGRVPAQASPPPGSYSDVVNVVITY